jgi:hypothetical protein
MTKTRKKNVCPKTKAARNKNSKEHKALQQPASRSVRALNYRNDFGETTECNNHPVTLIRIQ